MRDRSSARTACGSLTCPRIPLSPEGMTLSEYIGEDESRWKVQSNLSRLGMEEYETKLEQLSGGQRRKAAQAKVAGCGI